MTGHAVHWEHGSQSIRPAFTCTEPTAAPCRVLCTDCDCETWGEVKYDSNGDPYHQAVVDVADDGSYVLADHVMVEGGECQALLWLTEADGVELYDGADGAPARSGPIVLSWDEDGPTWEYAPEPAQPAAPALADVDDEVHGEHPALPEVPC